MMILYDDIIMLLLLVLVQPKPQLLLSVLNVVALTFFSTLIEGVGSIDVGWRCIPLPIGYYVIDSGRWCLRLV